MSKKIYTPIGANNHVPEEREKDDFYATDPFAIDLLLSVESFSGKKIWEPACGQGHMSKRLIEKGNSVYSTDLFYRGFGSGHCDFLGEENDNWDGHIITNPPYKLAQEFIEKSMQIMIPGNKLALFLKLLFLESKGRKEMFKKFPPKVIYVSSSRIACWKNGDPASIDSSAICYAWYVWEVGYRGETIIKWIN